VSLHTSTGMALLSQRTSNVTVPAFIARFDTVTPFCAHSAPPQPSPKRREVNTINNVFFKNSVFISFSLIQLSTEKRPPDYKQMI
jgi:hypothetical protein